MSTTDTAELTKIRTQRLADLNAHRAALLAELAEVETEIHEIHVLLIPKAV